MSTFDLDFEHDILAQCIRDEHYLKKASWLLASHLFATPEAGWVCGVVVDTWKKFGERANGRIFASKAREDFPDEDKRRTRLELVAKLMKRKPEASKSALAELGKFVRATTLQIGLEGAADALEKGKLEDAEAALQKTMRVNLAERDYTLVKWYEEFEERQAARRHEKEHPEEHKVIPTGVKRLDKYLVGGVRRGELALALGTTGRGKSIFLSNVVDSAVMHGYSAVEFALEMPARQVAMRHDSIRTRMRYDQFKGYNFKPSELREIEVAMKRIKKRFKKKFRIISMPVKSADIRKLKAALQDLYDDEGFIPDLIAVDSGDHLKAMDAKKEDIRVQHAEVYWGLKQWAEEEGKVIWSTTHAGREYAYQIATAEATSESYDKARIADLILSLNDPESRPGWGKKGKSVVSGDEDEEEEEATGYVAPSASKRLHMYIAKYRDGTSRTRIELDADFSRMIMEEADKEDREADDEAT
jgi:replicative DNA helicase